jgi:uncharacterized protein with ParB-like and HNH nuclease domain
MEISADENTVRRILTADFRMQVPEYQRKYSWTRDQWEEFWEDLKNIEGRGSHFLIL